MSLGKLAVTFLAISVVALPAIAADHTPRVEFGGFGGIVHFDHARGLNGNVYGGRFGINFNPHVGFETSIGRSNTSSPRAGVADEAIWLTQANLVWNLSRSWFQPFMAGGMGNQTSLIAGQAPVDNKFNYDVGGGFKMWMSDHVALRGDVHAFWTNADGAQTGGSDDRYRDVVSTVGLTFGAGNTDGGPDDADMDGVPDSIDRCSDTPYGVSIDAFGCPVDSDKDGVADYRDQCANTPASVWVNEVGCPTDEDRDGVSDGLDRCMSTPLGAMVDERGCPTDQDGDGVYDGLDSCNNTPRGAKVDSRGCEVVERVEPIAREVVLNNVNFASNSADILPASYATLDQVAASLVDNPEIRVEIHGHADAMGESSYNLSLTQRRAESVRAYMIAAGVSPERMRARGFGESQPVASNDSSEGRAMNRRVEFHRTD